MDRKTIIAIAVCALLLIVLQILPNKIFPPVPRPPSTNQLAGGTNAAAGTNSVAVTPPTAPEAVPPPATNAPAPIVPPGTPEQTVTLETPDARYTFTSSGGGLRDVELKHYNESVRKSGSVSNHLVILNEHGHAPVLAMRIDSALADNVFKVSRTETNTVLAEKVLPSGLRVIKLFEPGSNYAMRARIWLENTSTQALSLPTQVMTVGAAAPAGLEENVMMSGVFYHNGTKAEHIQNTWFDNRAFGCFYSRPRPEYDSGSTTVNWAAVHNQFFALAVIGDTNAVGSQFKAGRFALPPEGPKKQVQHVFEAQVLYPTVTIAPKAFVDRQYTIYAGPKQEKTLTRLGQHVDAIMDFGFWSPISKIFLRAMNLLHHVMPYGLAIIVITVIIKLIFWPLTQASTRSMKRMQALQPEIKKLQEKYKEDPAKQQKKMMELWKENKVNPMSGCWPMLIQLPIFFALFRMIPNAIELRGTPFLWVEDLSRPDTIFYIPGIDYPFNPLPLIMGVTMLWQARLAPPSPGMDPAQQTMMKYMPLIFLFFLYNQPAGLTLYWTVQNLLTIAQTKLTKAKEAKTAAAPAPVPVKKK